MRRIERRREHRHGIFLLGLLFAASLRAQDGPAERGADGAAAMFVRGDVDGAPGRGLGDALAILDALVRGRPVACLDAADTDDDGSVTARDAAALLGHLFQGDPPPPEPAAACGFDPTPDALGCETHPDCARTELSPQPVRSPAGAEASPGDAPRVGGGQIARHDAHADEAAREDESARASVTGRESAALPRAVPRGHTVGGGAGGRLVALGEIVAGEIVSQTQADRYLFEAAHGQWITADRIASTNVQGLNWRIEDAYGRVLRGPLSALDDLDPVALHGGLHTLVVLPEGSSTGAYEVRLVDATPLARAIALDEDVEDAIDPERPGQRHELTFTAVAGTTVFLDRLATGATSLDWWLEDARGRTLVARRLLGDFGPVALAGGTYRLSLAGRRSAGNLLGGDYQLRVSTVPAPSPRAIALGEVVSDSIAAPGEVDTFTFSAAAGQAVFIDQLSVSNVSIVNWELTDSAGRAIVARTTSLNDVGPLALLGGSYSLRVLGEGGATADYSFRVVDAPMSSASIALGAEVAGEIPVGQPGSVRRYELTAPADRVVTIEMIETSNLARLNWLLEDAHGRAVLPRTPTLLTTAPIPLLGGDYRLSVLGEGDGTGTYRFRVRDDGPATPPAAGTPVAVGDEIDGVIPTPAGEVRYTFVAAAGQIVYVDLIAGAQDLQWELIDDAGALFTRNRGDSPELLSDMGPYPLAAGSYTVVLRGLTATPPYHFRIAGATPATSDVTLGDTISGDFAGAPGALHRYRFTVAGGPGGERVFLDNLLVAPRLFWTLLDGVGQEVFPLSRADRLDDDAGPFPLLAGTYTLVLDPQVSFEPVYELAIRTVTDAADTAALGATIAGDFAGSAGSTRALDFDLSGETDLFIERLAAAGRLEGTLLDPAGEPVFGPQRIDTNPTLGPFTLGAGTHRLILDPPAGDEPSYELRVLAAGRLAAPLVFGAPASGALTTGATATYSFTALEGQRFVFDLLAGAPTLRWSLFDEFDQAVFLDQVASTATSDQGPLSLAAGDYRLVLHGTAANTPSYEFTAWLLPVDLAVSELAVSPRVVFEGDKKREVEVTWTVENLGGGPAPTGAWTDRLTLSTDATLGNADDVVLGAFARFDTLAPRSSYSRRETLRLPASLGRGQHRIFLAVDANDVHLETGAEEDNVARLEIEVVEDLPPAEPLFVSTTSFPFDFTARGVGQVLDLPLTRSVRLDSVRFILAEAVTMQLIPSAGLSAESRVTLSLLRGDDEVLEVATVSPSGSGLSTFAVRFSRRLTPQVIALLAVRTVDGVRFRFDQPSTTTLRLRSTHGDSRLAVHFAGCEFAPCGPHLERRSPGGESIAIAGTETSAWSVVDFDEPVPGDGLRLVSGPRFTGSTTGSIFSLAFTSSETQLILDDGSLVTLDDSRSPSTLANPAVTLSVDHSLLIDGAALAGRQVLGFQWRVHGASTGGAQAIYTPLDDQAVRFLYEVDACGGAIDIPPVTLEPADGSTFAPGSIVVLSGRALTPQPGRAVSGVLVNGEPVDSLDASGRFFKAVEIAEGENLFAVQVVEPGCGEPETLLRLLGSADGTSGLSGYAEATSLLDVEYADTSFVRISDSLLTRARVRNASSLPVRGPILMVLTDLRHPSLELAGAAGITDDGEPFTVLLESGSLAPGEAGPWVPLVFSNPERVPVRYGVRWLAPADRAPRFESVPPATAVVGREYRYAPAAVDADGDVIVMELARGPAGMTLDAAGVLCWTPGVADAGTHDVEVAAVTSLARTTQRWTLTAGAEPPNRPPYFTSLPAAQAAIGARYTYDAAAVDPDGDAVTFTLLEGPAGMTAGAADGFVDWSFALPGEHRVTLLAADGRGGEAVQSFLIGAGSVPSNPSAPRITSSPGTRARPGILYIYQPVASDPDGDVLAFTLAEAPAGMTIDPERGRIDWTPALADEGTHAVSLVVSDGRGGETRQTFEIVVGAGDENLPPVIESVPGGFALANELYRYTVEALDPEGEPLDFTLAAGPAGMTIDAVTGLLEWTPGAGAALSHVVTVEAIDPHGAAGRQVFELRVRDANAAPAITSPPPPGELTAGRVYQHDVEATDPDGDLLRYELAAGPPAVDVHPITGLVTWRTAPGDEGSHAVTVAVTDCCGGRAEASFTIDVLADVTPPVLSIGFPTSPAPVGQTVEVRVSATDDVAVIARTVTVECPPDAPRELALDVIGRATFSSPRTGYCTFEATAVDPSGNVATASAVLQIGNPEDPLDPHPPVVEILTPPPGSVITDVTSIAATISDATADGAPGSGVASWTVEIAPALTQLSLGGAGGGAGLAGGAGPRDGAGAGGTTPTPGFTEIGRGSGAVTNALLATFDPTMLPNGVYRLRIVANDGVQTGGVEFELSVAGDLKLGQFTFEVPDLVVPLAGLPIVVARRYDSLDTESGDFGAGWRLAHPGEVEDSALESRTGDGLVDLLATEPFRAGTRVYVTRPDGRRVGFTFKPRSKGGFLGMLHVPTFEADPGVHDRLEVVEPGGDFFVIAGIANQVGVPYNPTVYRLTTEEGVSYTLDEVSGLVRMADRSDNGIDVTPDGLFSELGPAVVFERDAAGRITRITQTGETPSPIELLYSYDGSGNLASFIDAVENETSYFYEDARFPHYITRVEDALGRSVIRNVHDDDGRLVAMCDADDDIATLAGCTVVEWEPGTRASTTFDARGNRIDRVYDERGREILERRYLDGTRFLESRSEYDDAGNLVLDVDPSGEEWTYEYDPEGREIARTDPLGRRSTTTWDECGEITAETAPDGSSMSYTIDASCNNVEVREPAGGVYRFVYDEYGDSTEVTDPVGNRWEFVYGGNGQLTRVVDPRGGSFVIENTDDGDVLSRTDPDGRRIDYEYDDAHRLVRETWNTTPATELTYEYDDAGQLVLATDGASEVRVDYFPTGRTSRVTTDGPGGAPPVTVDYAYDADGRVTSVTDSLGGATVYEYDGAGRLVSVRQSGAAVNEKRVDFISSDGWSVVEMQRFADLAGASPVASTELTYDCESCVDGPVSIVHRRAADGGVIHAIDLERDFRGVVSAMTDHEGRHDYVHDAGRRLVAAFHPGGGVQPDESYTYDAAGNRTSSHRGSYTHGYALGEGGNHIRTTDRHRYEHDRAGNLTRRVDLATGASTEFVYDHRYRLTAVIQRDAGGAETGRATYAYDAIDRRIRATENGVVTDTVHDGLRPIVLLDGTGDIRSRRLFTRSLDGVLAEESGGVTRWFLADHLGTVRDVITDGGASIAHLVYDSFGILLAGTLGTATGGVGFTARELSVATGLYSMAARDYDPELGRFLRRDPLTPFGYDYTLNSPLSYIDPTGDAGRRPINRPFSELRRPRSPPRPPGGDFGSNIPGYHRGGWGDQGKRGGRPVRSNPRGHAGGEFAMYLTLLDGISIPAVLGGFAVVAGAVGAALMGVVGALFFAALAGL